MSKPMFFYTGIYSDAGDAVLKHEVGDWDDAEQDALESVKQAEGATAVTT